MAKVKKTEKQLKQQLHPNSKKNNAKKKNKKKISKTKVIKKVVVKAGKATKQLVNNAKDTKVVQELKQTKVVENASKVTKELVTEAKQTKDEITDSKKEMKFHPLLAIVIGIAIGVIPFFFYHPTNNKDTNDTAGADCTYGEWKEQGTGYCMYNDSGEYYSGDTVKYEYNADTQNCTRYIRTKSCQ